MNAQRVREFKRMKESVRDDSRAVVRTSSFQESTNHLRPEDAAGLVAKLYRVTAAVRSYTGLDPHVEFTCAQFNNRNLVPVR